MLFLHRKIGERVLLDGGITVEVLAVHGHRVKLGIAAPPEVSIVREELRTAPTIARLLARKRQALAEAAEPERVRLEADIAKLEAVLMTLDASPPSGDLESASAG